MPAPKKSAEHVEDVPAGTIHTGETPGDVKKAEAKPAEPKDDGKPDDTGKTAGPMGQQNHDGGVPLPSDEDWAATLGMPAQMLPENQDESVKPKKD